MSVSVRYYQPGVSIFKRSLWSDGLLPRQTTSPHAYSLTKIIHGATPLQTFNIVSQIDLYDKYIPYCLESTVHKRDSSTHWPSEASLRIGFRQYDETFLCDVKCSGDEMGYRIVAECLSDILFHEFKCTWDITPHESTWNNGKGTNIKLSLQFEFKSSLYNSVARLFARSLTSLALNSFHRRIIQELRSLKRKEVVDKLTN